MLKQGTTQDVRLVLTKSRSVEEQRLAAAGRVVNGQRVARELQLQNASLVDTRWMQVRRPLPDNGRGGGGCRGTITSSSGGFDR
jgi:hypothetical protein